MKSGIAWIALTCSLVISLVLASCSTKTSIETSTITQSSTSTIIATSSATKTTLTTLSTTSPITTASGNWWNKLGTPQYGGTMTVRLNINPVMFDPYYGNRLASIETAWLERMFADDWTLDPSVFDFRITGRPSEDEKGLLAASWEFTDPSTFVVHLRQGVHWQNLPPANGREFVASDVVFHYDRMLGLGGGFKPNPAYSGYIFFQPLKGVTATDKYTVAFNWSISNPEAILETMMRVPGADVDIECPEAVQQWGNLNDWHHAVGTGPFILQDFVDGSSANLVKNPNYWGYDERYPKNQLPYVDTLRLLIIPDTATALAALRTGKIDAMDGIQYTQAASIQKTNPEISQILIPMSSGLSVDPRNDVKPLNDVRVREAMQMSLDLPTIASTYYHGNADPYPTTMPGRYLKGWGFPWEQWPADLQAQYSYNPTGAKQLLAQAGYPDGFKTDVVANTAGDMDLLQIVKSYFAAVGINMDIRPMDPASWTAYVTADKHDQMSFRGNSSILGTTDGPILQLNGFHTGASGNYMNISDPVFDAFSDQANAATSVDAAKQVIATASEHVDQQHYLISLLQPKLTALCQPWLKGYNGQDNSISGLVTPRLLCFYEARFWIDQNVKQSSGH